MTGSNRFVGCSEASTGRYARSLNDLLLPATLLCSAPFYGAFCDITPADLITKAVILVLKLQSLLHGSIPIWTSTQFRNYINYLVYRESGAVPRDIRDIRGVNVSLRDG